MTPRKAPAGYFHSGIPYKRMGHGSQNLVIFQGLLFENEPLSGAMVRRLVLHSSAYKLNNTAKRMQL